MARVIHFDRYYVFLGNKRRENVGIISTFPFGYMKLRSVRHFDDALALLARLHILSNNATTKLGLSPAFKSSMRQAITGGYTQTTLLLSLSTHMSSRSSGTSVSFGVPAESDDKRPAPSIDALDAYALERWEVYTARHGPYCELTISRPFCIIWFLLGLGRCLLNLLRGFFFSCSATASWR